MKKTLKVISIISLIIFAILWILGKLIVFDNFNIVEISNIFVIIYLLASLKYYQLDSRDKEIIIKKLKKRLGE